MKRFLFWLFVLAVAALNWAALHDILKGEQDVRLEWATVITAGLLLSVYLARKFREAKIN